MTTQEQAIQMVKGLPSSYDFSRLIKYIQKIKLSKADEEKTVNRFGAGKKVLNDPVDFDKWDSDLDRMFAGGLK